MRKILPALILFLLAPLAKASDFYYAQTAVGAANGTSCANAYAYNDGTNGWNASAKQAAGNTLHVCGAVTVAANSTAVTFINNGSGGNPLKLLFESGASLNAPYFSASNGAILMNGRSFITIDGGTNGIIQNTANGFGRANSVNSSFIQASPCANCIVQNLHLSNLYVRSAGNSFTGIDQTLIVAVKISGSNWTIQSNAFDNCGWCIEDFFGNNDTGQLISLNTFTNYDHGVAVGNGGSASPNALLGLKIDSNQFGTTKNWDLGPTSTSCPAHHDGVHTFTNLSGASMTELVISNNYFFGDWGVCPTAFFFIEGGGSSTPSRIVNGYYYNNVGVVPAGSVQNSWFQVFSGSGKAVVVNNTLVGPSNSDNTYAFNVGSVTNPFIENNVEVLAGAKTNYGSFSGTKTVDYNFYDTFCTGGNWFYNGTFVGCSITAWRSALSGGGVVGADANGVQNATPLLSALGAPQTGSPVLGVGNNLCAVLTCTGSLAALLSDTTLGGTRTPVVRPTGSTPWAMGAYQPAGSITPASVPTGLAASVNGSTVNLTWSASTGTAPITYNVSRATVSGGPYTLVASNISTTSYANTNLASGTYFFVVSATNAAGTSANSSQVSATVQPIVSIPSAPTNLTVANSGTSNVLNWTQSIGTPTGYHVLRGTVSGGPYSTIATLGVVSTYTDSGLANGTYFYVVNAFNTAGTSPNSNQISAVVSTQSAANLSPSTINFTSTVVGLTAPTQNVVLQNLGNANLVLASSSCVTLSGANAADFAIVSAPSCSSSQIPNASTQIVLSFTPSATGTRVASLVVASNDPGSPDSVSLSGIGVAPVTITPSSLNFGNQLQKKTSAPQTVTFFNNSGSTVTFSSIALNTGTQYAISANTCGASVLGGASCTISITFTPTSPGNKTDTLTFTDSAPGSTQTVSLQGQGKSKGILKVGAVVSWPYNGVDYVPAVLRNWRREWELSGI